MQIIKSIDNIPAFVNPVVTVGSFDGVHLGHRKILQQLRDTASRLKGVSVVVTFDPHPQQLLNPNSDFFLINTPEEKIKLLKKENIDYLIIIPFSKQFSEMSFTEYFEKIIVTAIRAKAIVMGPNHSFGKNREGNHETVMDIAKRENIEIIMIPEYIVKDCAVRSAKIRKHIVNKDYEIAEELLGHSL
jgi:riboflavin kinase / FMN adenylyltransferase